MRVRERPDPVTLPKCWMHRNRIEQFNEIVREPASRRGPQARLDRPLVKRGAFGKRQLDVQAADHLALAGELVRAHAVAFVCQRDPEIAQVFKDFFCCGSAAA